MRIILSERLPGIHGLTKGSRLQSSSEGSISRSITSNMLSTNPISASDASTALSTWQLATASSTARWQSIVWRSEEHTSELQSLMRISYAVFCLKKKLSKTSDKDTTPQHNIQKITQNQRSEEQKT